MIRWHSYMREGVPHTVTGDLRLGQGLPDAAGQHPRDLLVWLPPDYAASDRRYPVIYMHDGQNLFDAHTSYSGEWEIDETMTALHAEGLSAVVVGMVNAGANRPFEYSPYPFVRDGVRYEGHGHRYIEWIAGQVKPLIDSTFRTLPGPGTTGIAGSSMGGLISLYGFLARGDVFGWCGAFSTAYWFGDGALLTTIQQQASGAGRVYLDVGTQEGETLAGWGQGGGDLDAAYVRGVRDVRDALIAQGYVEGDTLWYVEDEGAPHRESAWARRAPAALRWLLAER